MDPLIIVTIDSILQTSCVVPVSPFDILKSLFVSKQRAVMRRLIFFSRFLHSFNILPEYDKIKIIKKTNSLLLKTNKECFVEFHYTPLY